MKASIALVFLGLIFGCAQNLPAPKAEVQCRPVYPSESKSLGEQGNVLVTFRIEISGEATNIRVKKSSGHARLDQAAIDFVRCSRFIPAKRNGVPMAMDYDSPVRFKIDD